MKRFSSVTIGVLFLEGNMSAREWVVLLHEVILCSYITETHTLLLNCITDFHFFIV